MDGKRLLHSLFVEQLLSFGRDGIKVELHPLNVLIGQNASGKSNFIQVLELLRATPTDLPSLISQGGGIEEFLYKGDKGLITPHILATVNDAGINELLRHEIVFTATNQHLNIVDESINSISGNPISYYKYRQGSPMIASKALGGPPAIPQSWVERQLAGVKSTVSILAQRNEPDLYPALHYLSEQYRAIKIYRNFSFDGPNSMRRPQQADLPANFLEEDGRNLSLVLARLQHQGVMETINDKLRVVYEDVERISVNLDGGTMQTYIYERGMSSPIPAARLSDGTLRYLCLLSILYHPTPPPLICLEEPEIGLHPDLISGLAEMLKEASQRTQIIVTTHSDLLVSKFSDQPEAVVVCERTPIGTTLKRLEAKALEGWLEEYSLGEVWLKGGIGGTRW